MKYTQTPATRAAMVLLVVLTNQTAARLLRGIVALSAALRLHTVAESVETWEEAFFLHAAGLDCA